MIQADDLIFYSSACKEHTQYRAITLREGLTLDYPLGIKEFQPSYGWLTLRLQTT